MMRYVPGRQPRPATSNTAMAAAFEAALVRCLEDHGRTDRLAELFTPAGSPIDDGSSAREPEEAS